MSTTGQRIVASLDNLGVGVVSIGSVTARELPIDEGLEDRPLIPAIANTETPKPSNFQR